MRAARDVLLALALPISLAAVGCAESTRGPLVGASEAWTSAPDPTSSSSQESGSSSRGSSKPVSTVWEGYAEVQSWPAVTSAPFLSRGHLPASQVEIRVNTPARAQYDALVTDTVFPDGSQLAELSRSGGHHYLMRKNAGAWSYFELDARGILLAKGALPLCAGCHAQAPSDGVFGMPRAL